MEKCKRCNQKTQLSKEDIDKMVNEVINMRGIRLVSDTEYKKRIGICMDCDKFEYGSTCMLCGCVMQVRTRLKDGKCPYPKQKKW